MSYDFVSRHFSRNWNCFYCLHEILAPLTFPSKLCALVGFNCTRWPSHVIIIKFNHASVFCGFVKRPSNTWYVSSVNKWDHFTIIFISMRRILSKMWICRKKNSFFDSSIATRFLNISLVRIPFVSDLIHLPFATMENVWNWSVLIAWSPKAWPQELQPLPSLVNGIGNRDYFRCKIHCEINVEHAWTWCDVSHRSTNQLPARCCLTQTIFNAPIKTSMSDKFD